MERDPKLARIICSKFSSTWDFVTQRAKIYAHSPTGCWHALWNTTSRGCCFRLAYEHLRTEKVVRPTVTRIERLVVAVRERGEAGLKPRLSQALNSVFS